jgi:polar amino acid transport system substrate-binding protein
MRVGVSENRPWTTLPTGGGGGGLEGALAAELARDLSARIEWVRAPESHLLEALALHELDLVIGGFTNAALRNGRVAITRPFYTDTLVVGAPTGVRPLRRLAGQQVSIRAADPAIAAFVRAFGGVPHPIPDLAQAPGLVAAPSWQLPSLGMSPAGITLREVGHVLAVPPGENAWKTYVERSLAKRVRVIGEILRTQRP